MARRKSVAKENHERWLVSYADLVTLLFAFFVVMFASSQTDKGKAKEVSEAVEKAFKDGGIPPKIAQILGGTVDDAGHGNQLLRGAAMLSPKATDPKPTPKPQPLDLPSAYSMLKGKLGKEISSGAVDLHIEQRGVIVGLNSAVFFPSGGDTVSTEVLSTLGEVASVLNQLGNPLRLEGHTDALPISNERFRSNWELSSARAIAMLRLLNEQQGVDLARMAVVGYADTHPLESNDTDEGRRKNRRVDIVIVSDFGMRSEPTQRNDAQAGQPPATTPTNGSKTAASTSAVAGEGAAAH